jgi:hypothetical protein
VAQKPQRRIRMWLEERRWRGRGELAWRERERQKWNLYDEQVKALLKEGGLPLKFSSFDERGNFLTELLGIISTTSLSFPNGLAMRETYALFVVKQGI